jgi:TetR/AcrR family transcriptional regulator
MTASSPTRTQAERADQTRARILDAAVLEFSANGMAGARTEQIAEAAGVNKALLYYYFNNKQALYDAALESVANRVMTIGMAALGAECSAGERLVRFTLSHFDRIHSQRAFQSLMQQEMMRLHRGEENAIAPLVDKVFRPGIERMRQVYAEGRDSGELIHADEMQIMYAALGANVFYFLSAPMTSLLLHTNPFDRAALEFRRKAAIEYLGNAIFIDREHGARVAARVLESTPMPEPAEKAAGPFGISKFGNLKNEIDVNKTNEVRRT